MTKSDRPWWQSQKQKEKDFEIIYLAVGIADVVEIYTDDSIPVIYIQNKKAIIIIISKNKLCTIYSFQYKGHSGF